MQCPPELSQRAIALKPSLTLEISAKAKALQNEGRDICSLSAGEPDFNTPDFITEAAREALANGMTRYGPAAGDPELREAIAQKLTQENGCPTTADQVLVTNGGKQAIYNLFQVLLNPGDEVLIPAPFWLSYPEMAALAGAASVIVPTSASTGFALDLDRLERSITPKTRLLVLNSPGNPTGRVASLDELKALAELLRRHPRVLVMSDEIYEYLLAEGEVHHSFPVNVAVGQCTLQQTHAVNGGIVTEGDGTSLAHVVHFGQLFTSSMFRQACHGQRFSRNPFVMGTTGEGQDIADCTRVIDGWRGAWEHRHRGVASLRSRSQPMLHAFFGLFSRLSEMGLSVHPS